MTAIAGGNRIIGGLRVDTDEYINIPSHAVHNIGVQQNFSVHFTGILLAPSTNTGFSRRNYIASKRASGAEAGVELSVIYDANLIPATISFGMYSTSGGRQSFRQVSIASLAGGNNILGRLISITGVKFNANPASSVSANEWKIYFNGYEATATTNDVAGGLLPSSLTTLADRPMYLNNVTTTTGFMSQLYYHAFSMFDRALTAEEVMFMRINGGKIPASAIGNRTIDYRFDEKQGLILNDRSANLLHADLQGFSAAEYSFGATNQWVNKYQQPYLAA